MVTVQLDQPNLRCSDYFAAMNQRKQELRAFAYFGAMILDNQFQKVQAITSFRPLSKRQRVILIATAHHQS